MRLDLGYLVGAMATVALYRLRLPMILKGRPGQKDHSGLLDGQLVIAAAWPIFLLLGLAAVARGDGRRRGTDHP